MRRLDAVPDGQAIASLSTQELEVLALAASGLLDKEIGPQLGISLNTLRTYWSRIRSKMGQAPRTALAAAYLADQYHSQIENAAEPVAFDWEVDLEAWTIVGLSEDDPTGVLPPGVRLPLNTLIELCHPEDRPSLVRMIEDARAGVLGEY